MDYSADDVSVLVALKDLTGGTGPDSCIDAVGVEAHSADCRAFTTLLKTRCSSKRTDLLYYVRRFWPCVRVEPFQSLESMVALLDKIPFGAVFGKGVTMKMGPTNMHNYMKPLLEKIEKGQIDPSYILPQNFSGRGSRDV